MGIQFSCNVVRYDPGEDYKLVAILIVDFEVEIGMLQKIVNDLLITPCLLPFKSIDFIDQNIGKFSDFYQGELMSRASIEFIDKHRVVLHFENGYIQGSIQEEELNKWGVQSVGEIFEGDIHKRVILTNYRYGQYHREATETYYISIKS